MTEEVKMSEVMDEIKSANEDELKKVISDWYEKTRTDGLKLGARYMSAAIYGVIQKHTKKPSKVSLNDYKRMTAEILKIVSVQLATENVSEEITMEDNNDDGTAESNDNSNS